jgi:hypothetical protein
MLKGAPADVGLSAVLVQLASRWTFVLIAGAVEFVIFIEKRNDFARGGRLRRYVSSIREVTGVDGRVLSSEVFTPGPGRRAVPHAPVACAALLAEHGYDPAGASW